MQIFMLIGVLAMAPYVVPQAVDTSLMYLNETQTIEKYNYSYELHPVTTEDKYELTLIRILPKIQNDKKKVVFLNHGLFVSSFVWLGRGAEVSLAFLLADAGHDVWLQNNRGNGVSMGGGPSGREYWDFGVDEMAIYDTTAAIDYVLNKTGVPKLDFIGHSQGNAMYAIMCIERPAYQEKIDKYIGLAPLFSMKYVSVVYNVGTIIGAASEAYYFVHGYTDELNSDLLKVILNHYPYHGSFKNIAHITQWIDKNEISKFHYDWGNRKHYGTVKPPVYDVSKLSVNPKYICYGVKDLVISYKAVEAAMQRIPNIVEEKLDYAHKDFIFGLTLKDKAINPEVFPTYEISKFDYGWGNRKYYGTVKPPVYDISKLSVNPKYIFYGAKDLVISYKAVEAAMQRIPNIVEKEKLDYAHNDFIFGLTLKDKVNQKVVDIVGQ